MRRELQFPLKLGFLFYAAALVLKHFFAAPELVMGFLLGLSICFFLLGILPQKRLQNLRAWKKAHFKRR